MNSEVTNQEERGPRLKVDLYQDVLDRMNDLQATAESPDVLKTGLDDLADEVYRRNFEGEEPDDASRGVILRFLDRFRKASEAQYQQRIGLCGECEHMRELIKIGSSPVIQCSLCGCAMNLKARLASSRCPAGKF